MDEFTKNKKKLIKLSWFFIVIGLIEVFAFIFYSGSLFGIIPGLITVISAYIMKNQKRIKWGYFVGIWAIIKIDPFLNFLLQDFFRSSSIDGILKPLVTIFQTVRIIVGILSMIAGIITIIKTAKQLSLIKNQSEEINL